MTGCAFIVSQECVFVKHSNINFERAEHSDSNPRSDQHCTNQGPKAGRRQINHQRISTFLMLPACYSLFIFWFTYGYPASMLSLLSFAIILYIAGAQI